MPTIRGIGVCPGTVAGPAIVMPEPVREPPPGCVADDPDAAVTQVAAAMEAVALELDRKAAAVQGELADILAATAMMARDPALAADAADRVRTGKCSAARAIWEAARVYRDMLAAAGGYLAERVSDLDDVRNRIIARLLGVPCPGIPDPGYPFVLVAHDLAPADTAGIDPTRVLGFITVGGGPTGHTAILAKALGIPAVVACTDARTIENACIVILDGASGTVVTHPDAEQLEVVKRLAAYPRKRRPLTPNAGRTADGETVLLLANVGDADDATQAVRGGAQGVGLFRTEFLFLGRATAPSVDEQARSYQEVFAAFPNRKVIVRTLDAGADKPLAFLEQSAEPNPALGVRGIRMARTHPQVLADQISAIAIAAQRSDALVHVMAPMIATAEEAAEFLVMARAAGLPSAGLMVEVPAAVLHAEAVFAGASFVSIGTNDLTQYAYAADRLSAPLALLNDHWQPAVLRLIEMTCRAAHRLSIPVSVCGEAASDADFATVLVGLGVRSLSMSPYALPFVDERLRSVTLDQCRQIAAEVLLSASADQARELVHRFLAPSPLAGLKASTA